MIIGHFADQFTDVSRIYDSIFLFIYSFHIPLFIFISGYFYKNKNITGKAIFFISIGFAYKICSAIIERFLGTINVEFNLLWDGGISWFMFAIAVYLITTKVLENQNIKFIFVFSILLALFVGYDQSIGDFLYLSRIIVFFPFYLIGVLLKKFDIVEFRKNNNQYIILGIIILAVWLGICFFKVDTFYGLRYLFTGRNSYFPKIMSIAPIIRLGCYVVSFIVGAAIVMVIPNNKIPIISDMGRNSINVYFWHMNVYYILNKLFRVLNLFFYGIQGKFAFLLLAIIISLLLSLNAFSFPIKQIRKFVL
ncbi:MULTISPECIES: acyltransferase family protein [Gemella]|uniref:acyltransferase family protein n=1 Tax=Gemella TaxID=1378 RepID=UPI000A8B3346|nr:MULTISPECIES: acyltransferase family protein [Gemella]